MSRLAELRDADELLARTYCLYVSPLRALGYDVEHNLRRPLREMGLLERPNTERARVRRGRVRETHVRTGVRTGDTPVEERRLMMSRPPHVLLTTPESLALMVAMDSYRKGLTHVETVIVDEVHALAGNKRGAQLALLLESLAELTRVPLRRVGLSATVSPLERVAAYLAGSDRACEVVDCRGLREIRLDVVAPFAGAMAPLAQCARTAYGLTKDVRSTLVFCNVRSQAERVAHEMEAAGERADEIAVEDGVPQPSTEKRDRRIGVHHSALERNVRHRTEAELRSGKLRTVVCSTSLELGVDIGYVDRVLVLGGARGMTPTLQRVGRAGHRPGAVATGVVIAQDRDDIVEAAATRRCIRDGVLEEIVVPDAPLDVLAQWLVGLCAPDNRVAFADALALARRAYPYRELAEADLRACAAYLSGGGAGPDEAHVRRIGMDADAVYGLGREPSSAYFENVGTIPDEQTIAVAGAGGHGIGRLDESFAASLREGDVILLEGRTLRVKEMGPRGLRVEPHAGRPTVPTWSSHMKGVPRELAARDRPPARRRRRRAARRHAARARVPEVALRAGRRRGRARRALRRAAARALRPARADPAGDRDLPHGQAPDRGLPHHGRPARERDAGPRRRRAAARAPPHLEHADHRRRRLPGRAPGAQVGARRGLGVAAAASTISTTTCWPRCARATCCASSSATSPTPGCWCCGAPAAARSAAARCAGTRRRSSTGCGRPTATSR